LIGQRDGNKRTIRDFIYYDDIAPHCLDSGIVIIEGPAFSKLWEICRKTGFEVVADVHTHPRQPYQSTTDQKNPMIGIAGHVAIIVPNFAQNIVYAHELGVFEYKGNHKWKSLLGRNAEKFFYIGEWS
jgi:hypothetical protein